MSWIENHQASERFASAAQTAQRDGRREEAQELYARAGDAERQAVEELDATKTRTIGISSVSAVSLYYKAALFDRKAALFDRAEETAYRWLRADSLPAFAKEQLRYLLQSIWSERTRSSASGEFASGEILISVQGGEVVAGGAPLDLVVDKVKIVQSLFHRTAELLHGLEHRRRGAPSKEIQTSCRPWLFHTAPGSYQFAVAIQREHQPRLFSKSPSPGDVAERFLQILRTGIEDPDNGLAEVVQPLNYRNTFLKLTRNLAPDGRVCKKLDIRQPGDSGSISLDAEVRDKLGDVIRKNKPGNETPGAAQPQSLQGVLRAVHLDHDWLDVTLDDGQSCHVHAVGEEVDDVIGPLINRPVVVYATTVAGKYRFLDIEPGT